jgi:hypothetical protein
MALVEQQAKFMLRPQLPLAAILFAIPAYQ